jgi:hypothetical protein
VRPPKAQSHVNGINGRFDLAAIIAKQASQKAGREAAIRARKAERQVAGVPKAPPLAVTSEALAPAPAPAHAANQDPQWTITYTG